MRQYGNTSNTALLLGSRDDSNIQQKADDLLNEIDTIVDSWEQAVKEHPRRFKRYSRLLRQAFPLAEFDFAP